MKSKNKKSAVARTHQSMDIILLMTVLVLSIFGIIMVYDSSANLTLNRYHFVILQSLWVVLGTIGMMTASFFNYRRVSKASFPMLLLCILLLGLVLVVGRKTNGAVRWINLGAFQLQPSEIIKPVFVLYLASIFSKHQSIIAPFTEKLKHAFLYQMVPFAVITFLILGLVLLGKDLGTAIIIFSIACGMFFLQCQEVVNFINLIGFIFVSCVGLGASILFEPYRMQRLLNFSGQSNNTLGSGYQINQILIAIGSGGWLGKGFTQSIQKQRYLVETTAATDSIYAVIAEEFGFLGSLMLFAGYMSLFYRCIRIALRTRDELGKLIVMGIVTWIIAQTLLNIAVNVKLVPLTGVPLPFISYGGSSSIIMLSSIGIILNISKERYED